MAQNQAGTQGKSGQSQSGMQGTSGMQGQQGHMGTQTQTRGRAGERDTGADNLTYDLVSVIYHALHAAQTYQQYENDAQRGDKQFSDFFRRVADNNKQCAQEALDLLQQCMGRQGTQHGGQSMQGQSSQAGGSEQGDESGHYGRGTR